MDTALVKSNFSRSGPSIEIRSKVSKDDTVRRFLNVVLTLTLSLSLHCSLEGQVQSGQT